ncbi:MAG: energy-coupling factor transporter transmembrane protein EcfT [Treponema sp.]|jgi:hypothetical protein|nr:energy-coupling factor transporter transmembrane protein EcfT [Treponema sp.]
MSINEKLHTPLWIFIVYVVVAGALIMIFRFIFPGSAAPVLIFSRDWRLIQGALELFNLFPALVFSALVLPFGIASFEEDYPSFSDVFFKKLISSVLIAISAAVVYGAIFFFAYPMVKNYEGNLRYKGDMYHLAKENARLHCKKGEWVEASQFIAICDQVWENSPELTEIRTEIEINLHHIYLEEVEERSKARAELAREWRGAEVRALPGGQQPLDAIQSLAMSSAAFAERRYFDAHWLAILAGRLATEGSPEAAAAARLASDAWNQIESQSPSIREERMHFLHQLKLSGYEAMNNSDWIAAYYIFLELLDATPDDPDAKNFFAKCEDGLKDYTFFIDEMQLSLGEMLTGALFSLPAQAGRAVIRFSNLSTSADFAYGMGFEYMEFDASSRPNISIKATYAKLLPVTVNGKNRIMVITHALNRHNKNISWEGEWLLGDDNISVIMLDISFEDFLLLSGVRRGLTTLQVDELFAASKKLGKLGYVPEIFEAEILNRISSTVFFLPIAILVVVIGWRYRTKTRPRYFFFLLLPMLPVVFNGLVFLYRNLLNTVGIWLVISLGFAAALTIFIVALAVILFVSLIILAAQHG